MTNEQPQLPPTRAIATKPTWQATSDSWFEYPIKAHPHHTDYGGMVWHGCYIAWMEEARVECLRSIGIEFADLVKIGCDLPVVELSARYHQPMRLGNEAIVKARTNGMDGVRIHWDYQIQSPQPTAPELSPLIYLTARVTLVAVDREKGKILRQLPPLVKDALVKLSGLS
ncbi:MAG: thioesterase family protein [Cyanobacteriota bacterium]|nr:thioesterase family protein [Cyanobacteriota bacterium]